jgi:hypothetical protein
MAARLLVIIAFCAIAMSAVFVSKVVNDASAKPTQTPLKR